MLRDSAGHTTWKKLGDERGSSAVFIALTMTALLSAVALAVDVGMLLSSRSEAQRAADSGALAGAGSLIAQPNDEDRARAIAIEFGEQNTVRKAAVEVLPEDVDVDLANARVTVRVRRTADRGSAVGTWFARIFGVDQVDIAATATAQASPAGAATCLKPLTLPDLYDDVNGNGQWDDGIDIYDPLTTGYGSDFRNPGQPGDDGQGYYNDYGRQVTLKAGGPIHQPSWYYPWEQPDWQGGPSTGAARYRWSLANCNPTVVYIGTEYPVETGNMQGPTRQGVLDMIALDSNAHWDPFTETVAGSDWAPAWEGSPRIGVVPTFDPSRVFNPGSQPIEFSNFIAVFFESVQGGGNNQTVTGRILYPFGVGGGDPGAGSNARFVQLVE